jgi:hypothetical protein
MRPPRTTDTPSCQTSLATCENEAPGLLPGGARRGGGIRRQASGRWPGLGSGV